MSLEQVEPMESDIVPQKSLNDIDSMYTLLTQRLNSSKAITDLIPFIEKLIPLQQLQQYLKASLDTKYQCVKSMEVNDGKEERIESENNIRSLFISLFALNGIPSDNIHAHILSYLPAREYKKLPLLSTHFRYILKKSTWLYNNNGYRIQLEISRNNLKLEKSDDYQTAIKVYHNSEFSNHPGIHFVALSSNIAKRNLSPENLNNMILPISQIKRWKVFEEWINDFSFGMNTINPEIDHFKNKHNKYMIDLLSQNASKIEKLEIMRMVKADIIQNVFRYQYNHCIAIYLHNSSNIIINKSTFMNLECLEVFRSPSCSQRLRVGTINKIMELTQDTLKCVSYIDAARMAYGPWMSNNNTESLNIPAN